MLWAGDDGSFAGSRPEVLIAEPGEQNLARFSPDGRWLAYESSRGGGTLEVFVTAFPSLRGRWQLSEGGGQLPMWSGDGRTIQYLRRSGGAGAELVSISVDPGADALNPGPPETVLRVPLAGDLAGGMRLIDRWPDRDEFIALVRRGDRGPEPRSVMVFDWLDELRRQVTADR